MHSSKLFKSIYQLVLAMTLVLTPIVLVPSIGMANTETTIEHEINPFSKDSIPRWKRYPSRMSVGKMNETAKRQYVEDMPAAAVMTLTLKNIDVAPDALLGEMQENGLMEFIPKSEDRGKATLIGLRHQAKSRQVELLIARESTDKFTSQDVREIRSRIKKAFGKKQKGMTLESKIFTDEKSNNLKVIEMPLTSPSGQKNGGERFIYLPVVALLDAEKMSDISRSLNGVKIAGWRPITTEDRIHHNSKAKTSKKSGETSAAAVRPWTLGYMMQIANSHRNTGKANSRPVPAKARHHDGRGPGRRGVKRRQ